MNLSNGKPMVRNSLNIFLVTLVAALVFFGFLFSFTSNYGSDNDTYGMLRTFIHLIQGDGYIPSRFMGSPVAEIGIGLIAYFFGSWLNNLVSFSFFIFAAILIYRTFISAKFDYRFLIFLILCLTNAVLFFDNIAPTDHSWALFFFSLGLHFLKKKDLILSAIFFGTSIGTRINYVAFCVVAILFFTYSKPLSKYKRFSLIFITTFIGALFYLPIWFESGLQFDWLTTGRPTNQGIIGLVARFFYKSWMALGLFVTPVLVYSLIRFRTSLYQLNNLKLIFFLIGTNLLIYLYSPADRYYLQLALILIFTVLVFVPKVYHLWFVALNFLSWFFLISPLEFSMKSNDPCDYIEAIGVSFYPHISKGELQTFRLGQQQYICYEIQLENSEEILKDGLKLKQN